ncbi:hypothetical protein FE840_009730 [Peteryoungia desertarenae]|uniref:Uncharacterized protein n=1 Tax=Peteryoungia desertarenae TaxID=1813451 RepID=A0ABX6QNH1_9HYPH|nr:ABZJ_00895 family protein [Peteryoungia desertarenae]QLF69797.1 hypothetical protein FE840_009730 [Peteryoungia desertarenae]
MPPFLNRLVLRYALVFLLCEAAMWLIMLGLNVGEDAYVEWIGANVAVSFASAAYAGLYFAQEKRRVPDWGESVTLSCVLVAIYVLYSLVLFGVISILGMATIRIAVDQIGASLTEVLLMALAQVIVLPFIINVIAVRTGASSLIKVLNKYPQKEE